MAYADYGPGEISARGAAIYLEQIFPTLGSEDLGKHVSIDIESGDYEIDAEQIYAMLRLQERRREGVFYGVRVGCWSPDGHPVSGFIGLGPRCSPYNSRAGASDLKEGMEGNMPYADYGPGEISARGAAIYLEQIFPTLGPEESGKFVSIDIESGDYEIDAEDPYAFQRLLERRPEGVFYGVRVGCWSPDGHPVSGFIGLGPRVAR